MRDAPSYEPIYIQNYDDSNNKKALSGYCLHKSHELLEKILLSSEVIGTILEVGAGTGHHFPYVKKNYSKYIMTDSNQDMITIASEKYSNEVTSGLLIIEQQNAIRTNYPDSSFDRLIATHVLEHLSDPVIALKEWNRIVRPGGIISIALPCDPGLIWRIGRNFGPRRKAQKLNMSYDYTQAAEHVNSIFNLIVFIQYHFEHLIERWYPLRIPIPDLNLFYLCHIVV